MSDPKYWKGLDGNYTGYVNSGIIAQLQAENERQRSKINELILELKITHQRLHLVKSTTVPLSVVEEVLEECALHTDFFINGCWEAVLKEIKKKAGL